MLHSSCQRATVAQCTLTHLAVTVTFDAQAWPSPSVSTLAVRGIL